MSINLRKNKMYLSGKSATVGGMFTAKRVFVPAQPERQEVEEYEDDGVDLEEEEKPEVKPVKKMKGRLPGIKLLRRLESMRITKDS